VLEGLASIRWENLEHAYGDASNLPKWLHELTSESAEVRDEALVYVRQSVYHQSGDYTAAPATIPFLIELLAVRDRPIDRAGILHLLALLNEGYRLPRGLSARLDPWPEFDGYFSPFAVAEIFPRSYRAVGEGGALYLDLLADPDPEVATAAAYLSCGYPALAEPAVPRIVRALEGALPSEHRASLMLSLGMLLRHTGQHRELRTVDDACTDSDERCRWAAVLARVYAGALVDRDRIAIRELLGPRSFLIPAWGDTTTLVGHALEHLHTRGEPHLIELLLEALRTAASAWPERGGKPFSHLGALLRFGFGGAPSKRRDVEALPTAQRRILVAIAEALPPDQLALFLDDQYGLFVRHGLPEADALRAALALPAVRSDTVLDRRLEPGGPTLAERWNELTATEEPGSSRVLELVEPLAPDELAELFERCLGRHREWAPGTNALAHMVRCADHAARDPRWHDALRARAAAIARDGQYNGVALVGARLVCQLFAGLLARSARDRDVPVSEHVEQLLHAQDIVRSYTDLSDLLRETLLALPRPRRDEAIDAMTIYSHAEPGEAWPLFELAPSAEHTAKLLELLDEWPEHFVGATAVRAVQVLVAQLAPGAGVLRAALADPARAQRRFAALALAHLPPAERAPLFVALAPGDPQLQAIATWAVTSDGPPDAAVFAAAGIDMTAPPAPLRGGVIGRDGRLWDGTPWR
jgi:hypothetical protein